MLRGDVCCSIHALVLLALHPAYRKLNQKVVWQCTAAYNSKTLLQRCFMCHAQILCATFLALECNHDDTCHPTFTNQTWFGPHILLVILLHLLQLLQYVLGLLTQ